jgi:hypothetical protein
VNLNRWNKIPFFLSFRRRRRKQQKLLESIEKANLSSRYLDTSGTSSRAQLVTPLPPPLPNNTIHDSYPSHRRASVSQNVHYPLSTSSFAQNTERYYRESQSDFDLHHNSTNGIDYRHHASIPCRVRPIAANGNYRGYGTVDHGSYNYDGNHHRRSLPRSFSDCDLCKRRVINEEYQQYSNEHDNNWHLDNTLEQRAEPRSYRDKIKERFRERLTVRQTPDSDVLPTSTTTVEYSTVLPRHQRMSSESNGPVHHLPFEYIPNENPTTLRTVEFKRSLSHERLPTGNNQQRIASDESGTTNFTVKFYEHDDDDDAKTHLDRCLHEGREVQEMSMRMNEQQNFNRHQYYHQQQRRFTGDNSDV